MKPTLTIDWDFITDLRNTTYKYFKTQHSVWTKFQIKNHLQNSIIYQFKPFGFVVIQDDELSIVVSPKYQNQGKGILMLNSITDKIPKTCFVTINLKNLSSFELFYKLSKKLNKVEDK